MTRTLPAVLIPALQAESVKFCHLVELDYWTGAVEATLRLTDAPADVIADVGSGDVTFVGAGEFIGWGGASETPDRGGQSTRLALTGVAQTITSILLGNDFRNRGVRIWRAYIAKGSHYIDMPGAGGDHASTPFFESMNVSGKLDVRVRCSLADWQRAARDGFAGAWQNAGSWAFTTNTLGQLRLDVRDELVANHGYQMTSAVTYANDEIKWIRFVVDPDNGSNSECRFYDSDDGLTWNLLETKTSTQFTNLLAAATTPMFVGNYQVTGGTPMDGAFYNLHVLDGEDGTPIVTADFDRPAGWDGSSFRDATLHDWTVNGNATRVDVSGGEVVAVVQMFVGLQSGDYSWKEERDSEGAGKGTVRIDTRVASRMSELQLRRPVLTSTISHNNMLKRAGIATGDTFFQNMPADANRQAQWGERRDELVRGWAAWRDSMARGERG